MVTRAQTRAQIQSHTDSPRQAVGIPGAAMPRPQAQTMVQRMEAGTKTAGARAAVRPTHPTPKSNTGAGTPHNAAAVEEDQKVAHGVVVAGNTHPLPRAARTANMASLAGAGRAVARTKTGVDGVRVANTAKSAHAPVGSRTVSPAASAVAQMYVDDAGFRETGMPVLSPV